MTKAELIAEVKRLRPKPRRPSPIAGSNFIEYPKPKKDKRPITAGVDLKKDDLLVVDEASRIAYGYPEVKTVPKKVRIHGYAARDFKKGQQVKIRHWLTYEPT